LALRVDTGVGATGADELDLMAAKVRDGTCQFTRNGPLTGLAGETPESRAVVSDDHAHPNGVVRRRLHAIRRPSVDR